MPLLCYFYCAQMKLQKGNVLHLSVSHSVHRGRCTPPRQTPPRQTPPGRHLDTPLADTPSLADTPGRHPPSPRQPLQRTIPILLECFLVLKRKTSFFTCTASVLFVGNLRGLWPKNNNSKQMSFVFRYRHGI